MQLDLSQVNRDDRDVTQENATSWAAWLQAQLRGRSRKYLMERSGGKIADGVLSRWLAGKTRPRPELAALVADILGLDRSVSLRAAGYEDLVPLHHEERPPPPEPVDELLQELVDMDIPDGVKKVLLDTRKRTIAEFQERRAKELDDARRIAAAWEQKSERKPG